MTGQMITDFAELRRPIDAVLVHLVHAWAEGDNTHCEGGAEDDNPYTAGPLRFAWLAGFNQRPLPGVVGEDADDVVFQLPVSHHKEDVDPVELRTVSSLRALHGKHAWTYSTPQHAAAVEIGQVA